MTFAKLELSALRARTLLLNELRARNILNVTVKGKTVDFTDLARASAVFAEVRGFTGDAPTADALKAFGRANGFIVRFV